MKTVEEKFALIGAFVYHFEFIVMSIRHNCRIALGPTNTERGKMIEIIFSQKLWSAEPLISTFVSIANESLSKYDDPAKKEKLRELAEFKNRFVKLVEFRNELLHGEHWYDFEINDRMLVLKGSQTKKGHAVKEVVSNITDLEEKVKAVEQLSSEVIVLFGQIISHMAHPDL